MENLGTHIYVRARDVDIDQATNAERRLVGLGLAVDTLDRQVNSQHPSNIAFKMSALSVVAMASATSDLSRRMLSMLVSAGGEDDFNFEMIAGTDESSHPGRVQQKHPQ